MSIRTGVLVIALGMIAAALAALPALSFAQQGDPPPPPMALIYGQVSGGTAGQAVVAFVQSGGTSTMCGAGTVMNEPGVGTVYAVDVERDSSVEGCGTTGRQVRLYFARVGTTPPRFATQLVTLTSNEFQTHQVDVTLGAALSNRAIAPGISANVSR